MNRPVEKEVFSLRRELPSRLAEVEAFCHELRALCRRESLSSRAFAVELVAREALNNAVLHGNAGDEKKRVTFELRCGREWIRLSIRDEGPGFHWRARRREVPSGAADSGRGLPILALYAARVQFNRCGNRVTLWLRKNAPAATRRAPMGATPDTPPRITHRQTRT